MRQVTAAVIIEGGLLFLVRRAPGQSLGGKWELPGGKIEAGETPQACLERELAEELGMKSRVGGELARTVYHYPHGSFELIAVAVQRQSGFQLRVHDAQMWASQERVGTAELAPADVELIAQLTGLGYWRNT